MKRILLFFSGLLLGLAAEAVLWSAPELYSSVDSWHSVAVTQTVGVAVIVEGALLALWAAACLARALYPLKTADRGGPVLPLCGVLILIAGFGPWGQSGIEREQLEVMDSMPGKWGAELVQDFRRHERTARAFAVVWFVTGAALMDTPLYLSRRVWRLGWRISGVGCGIMVGGFCISSVGALVCLMNVMLMEGANKDFAAAGYMALLAGAVVAVAGSLVALAAKAGAAPVGDA
jgi:hypothetical protein